MTADPVYLRRFSDGLLPWLIWCEAAEELRARAAEAAAEADMQMEVDLIVADHGVAPHPRGLE